MFIANTPVSFVSQDSTERREWEQYKQRVLDARRQGLDYLPRARKTNVRPQSIKYEGPFYRFIGQSELDKLLAGEQIVSNRECHDGKRTDVTNNPQYLYGMYGSAKYRIQFKQTDKFDPVITAFDYTGPRTTAKNRERGEYHLKGTYSLEDVEEIDILEPGVEWEKFRKVPLPRPFHMTSAASQEDNGLSSSNPRVDADRLELSSSRALTSEAKPAPLPHDGDQLDLNTSGNTTVVESVTPSDHGDQFLIRRPHANRIPRE